MDLYVHNYFVRLQNILYIFVRIHIFYRCKELLLRPQNLLYITNYLLHVKIIVVCLTTVYVYKTMFVYTTILYTHNTHGVCIE